ncbi:hypothetical protein KY343_03780 [Candidatus Woesearchaeota archaeon]|nr:hypothetical protein [Candidatus Woesearchaeota archaeon]
MKLVKTIAILAAIIVILNITLLAFGLIDLFLFWIILIAVAIIAYFGIPYLREIEEKTAPKKEEAAEK